MLDIKNLKISFVEKNTTEVVHGINLHMDGGEKLGLVGESGSGKSITALTIAGLIKRQKMEISGEINFLGQNLLDCSRQELRAIQGKDICMVFQEPMTSLNPLMRIGYQIEECLKLHTDLSAVQRKSLALEVMEKVGLPNPEKTYMKYPHELSGGQRQRALIASAFIINPKLLIADEPTTALDVTVQAQIIDLLNRISDAHNIGILFISHDLNIVRKICDRVAVMKDGNIVEIGNTEDIFNSPKDEYTRKLIAAIPTRKNRKR